ncbi:MAG: hypothetical protein K2L87_06815, partial [Clostridiales bacterium]|nr:hypothetical protein [Clostridiales bacterium]
GTVAYEYYAANKTTKLTEKPTAAGTYYVRCFVASTDDYALLEEYVKFEIRKVEGVFSERPYASSWIWDHFDRTTHRFTAAVEEGTITFAVLRGTQVIAGLEEIVLENVDGEWLIPTKYVSILNGLPQGTYTLRADVAETTNYTEFSDTATFTVTEATNTWEVNPSVVPWSYYQWSKDVNTPDARAQYGEVEITIVQDGTGIVYYHKKGAVADINELITAEIGWYTLTAKVPAEPGKYRGTQEDGMLLGTMRFQIFVQGSPDEANYWTVTPAISSWTATTDKQEILNNYLPVGTPARGLPYFVFYKAVWNEKEEKYERGAEIIASDEYVVKVNMRTADNLLKYFKDWYVPMEPGHYFMVACVERPGYDSEKLEERAIEFDIRYRANRFEQEPHIDSVLYLGDRANWVAPTAKAYIAGEISYVYIN